MYLSSLFLKKDLQQGPSGKNAGITLVELLVGLFVAGVVAAAAGSALVSQIKSSVYLEVAQRQLDNAGRLDYLIQIEAGEAASVVTNVQVPSDDCTGSGAAVAAFRIPRDVGEYLSLDNSSFVYYYNNGGNVWRCGPKVERSGVLNHDSSVSLQSGIVVRDALLEKVECGDEETSESQFVYRLVFPSGAQPSCAVARAKTLLICNEGDVCD